MRPRSPQEVLGGRELTCLTSGERVGLPGFNGSVDRLSCLFPHKRLSRVFVSHKQLQIGRKK